LYAVAAGFKLYLRSVLGGRSGTEFFPIEPFNLDLFRQGTKLGGAQADALIDCPSRLMGLIQGPPGAGKSFTGVALTKALLAIRTQTKLGPIIKPATLAAPGPSCWSILCAMTPSRFAKLAHARSRKILSRLQLAVCCPRCAVDKCRKARETGSQVCAGRGEGGIYSIVTELPHIEDPNILKVYLEVNHLDYHDQLFYDGDGWWRVRNYKSSEIRGWLQGAQWGMSISIAKCRYLGSEFA